MKASKLVQIENIFPDFEKFARAKKAREWNLGSGPEIPRYGAGR